MTTNDKFCVALAALGAFAFILTMTFGYIVPKDKVLTLAGDCMVESGVKG